MHIRRLYIKGFGKLKSFELELKPGLNVVYGPNESGKTTLYNFIRSCICGLSEEELEKYRPWDGSELDGGIVVLHGGKELKLFSTFGEKPFERNFADSLIFLSDEEDLTLRKAEDHLIARMKSNLQRVEEAQLIEDALKKIPRYAEELLSQRKQLEEQLNRLDEQIEAFYRARKQQFSNFVEISRLKQELSLLQEEKTKLQAQIARLNEKIEEFLRQRLEELDRRLREVLQTLEREKKLTILNGAQYEQISNVKAQLDRLNTIIEQRRSRVEEVSKLLEETVKQRDELMHTIRSEDVETFKLKLKNLRLTYRLLESNFQKLKEFESRYEASWKAFEGLREDFLEEVMKETVNFQEQEEARLQSRLKLLEENVSESRKKISRSRIIAIVSALAAVASTILGFVVASWWFFLTGGLGAITLIFLTNVWRLDKQLSRDEEEMLKYQLELRAIEKRKSSATQRLLANFGVKDVSQLRQLYQRYRDWLSEKDRFERLKQELEMETKNMLEQLRPYGAEELSDVPSVILRLEEIVSSIDDKSLKIAQLKEVSQRLQDELSDLQRQKLSLEGELRELLERFGLESFEEVSGAYERYRRVEEFEAERSKLERTKQCLQERNFECLLRQYQTLSTLLDEKAGFENLSKDVDRQIESLQTRLSELESTLNEGTLLERVVELLKEKSLIELRSRIVEMKLERLPSLSQFLHSELERLTGSYVKKFANLFVPTFRMFSKLAENVVVDKDLSVRIVAGNDLHLSTDVLSRATIDQLILSYKTALHDTLELSEPLPLIVDNFLIRFDEERLKVAAELLKEISQTRQVLIMTSDRRLIDLLGVQPVARLNAT
ncbi:ATP-binding protein [Thermotoga caldifontis]|uniref:ATP-binding protein n=1 Tax=Thermotoga caldifontis TaxID=1508419 RepID=UPI0005979D3D|nr:AAA family ATPase [Thermotoga caldifontis]